MVDDMKKELFIIGLTCLLFMVMLSGCVEKDSSSDVVSNQETKSQVNPPETESIQTILTKAETIDSMYYEIAADIYMPQFGTQTATIKIWQETPYIKEEISSVSGSFSTTISVIQRPDGTYVYSDELGGYSLTTEDVSSISTSLEYFNSDMISAYIQDQTDTDFDTEIIDGKETTIIEFSPDQDGEFMTVKVWIWNEKGVPLKAYLDMTMEEISMTMDFTFSNYSFKDIPDSVFSIT